MNLNKQTFKSMITTWYYAGFVMGIEFTFFNPKHAAYQLDYLTKLVKKGDLQDAEAYATIILERAVVPGVVEYNLTGK